ncbi:MAG: nuclear transport factor 2 family protein [Parvibaculales bacterium]
MDLVEMERIKRLKYSYCRAIDSCDLATLEGIFTEDASIDYFGGSYRFSATGRDEILTAMKYAFHDKLVSCHSVTMPVIDVLSPTTATGKWRLVDYAMNLAEDNKVTVGASEYVDDYVLDGAGNWRIKSSRYTRVYEQVFLQDHHNLTHYQLGGGHVPGPFTYVEE